MVPHTLRLWCLLIRELTFLSTGITEQHCAHPVYLKFGCSLQPWPEAGFA